MCKQTNETTMFRASLLFLCCVTKLSFGSIYKTSEQWDHCFLPDHPANGEIKIVGQKEDPYLPGSVVVPNTTIDLSCTNGTVTETLGLSRAVCKQGEWSSFAAERRCVRTCPPVQTEREDLFVTCVHKNPKVNCSNPIEGTIIQLACKPFYQSVGRSIITCRNGTWDGVISPCRPECGKKRVVTGAESKYPWVAGIYYLMHYSVYFEAGATLISRQTLLSVAHIFTSRKGVRYDINNYVVTAGKYYREFEDQRDTNMQFSRIKRLYIPENYRTAFNEDDTGDLATFKENDLGNFAIITLRDPFILTEYVQPVCIDWTNQFESSDLNEVTKGVIAGWGFTQTGNIEGREEQHDLNVRYKSKDKCSMIPIHVEAFHTDDKFCGGYGDNNPCDTGDLSDSLHFGLAGDAGSGLFFQNLDSRFYIRGILTRIATKSFKCRFPGLYTKISTYLPEIAKDTNGTLQI